MRAEQADTKREHLHAPVRSISASASVRAASWVVRLACLGRGRGLARGVDPRPPCDRDIRLCPGRAPASSVESETVRLSSVPSRAEGDGHEEGREAHHDRPHFDGAGGGVPRGSGWIGVAAAPKCFGKKATVVGTKKADVLKGTAKADVIVGLGGNDKIKALGGEDRICGGKGNDKLYGGPGYDLIWGDVGNDQLFNQGGKDDMWGNAGNDTLDGGVRRRLGVVLGRAERGDRRSVDRTGDR